MSRLQYIKEIHEVTGEKNIITYNTLKDTITRLYGKEDQNGGTIIDGELFRQVLYSILTEDVAIAANSLTTAINAKNIFNVIYYTESGELYITEK